MDGIGPFGILNGNKKQRISRLGDFIILKKNLSSMYLVIILILLSCTNYVTENGGSSDVNATVTDTDGNMYQTVKIGEQWWMAQNLKVTHYRNGEPIHIIISDTNWKSYGYDSIGACCYYSNDESNVPIFGLLYNWYAINDERNIAPDGWHVSTDEDWVQLEKYLGISENEVWILDHIGRGTDEGGKLKEIGTSLWESPNYGATNEVGFSAFPSGYRYDTSYHKGYVADFWTSSVTIGGTTNYPIYRGLHYANSRIIRNYIWEGVGYSVRCVKD